MNKRLEAKARTRAKLIETARALWAEPGSYETATIRVIASAAGLSTGSIFSNWTGKAELWREAMGYEPPADTAAVRALLQREAQALAQREAA